MQERPKQVAPLFKGRRLKKAQEAIIAKHESSYQPQFWRLNSYIKAALEIYTQSTTQLSEKRENTINSINEILRDIQGKYPTDSNKLAAIQALFHGPNSTYDYGPFGNSYLFDCVQAAIYLWRYEVDIPNKKKEHEKILDTSSREEGISLNVKNNTIKRFQGREEKNKENPTNSKRNYELIQYTRNDFIDFAVKHYLDEHLTLDESELKLIQSSVQSFKDYENHNIQPNSLKRHIFNALAFFDELNDKQQHDNVITSYIKFLQKKKKTQIEIVQSHIHTLKKQTKDIEMISAYIDNSSTIPVSEKKIRELIEKDNLPSDVKQALNLILEKNREISEITQMDSDQTYPRVLNTRTWHPDPNLASNPNAGKVIFAVHGLDDSSTTWEAQAAKWTKEGYTVISYDHAGHGMDTYRNVGRLNLELMRYDFYHQLQKLQTSNQFEEIHIVAQSAGGSLVAQSLKTIEKISEVKTITLISPAVIESPIKMAGALPTLLTNPNDTEESIDLIRKTGNSGTGGPGVKWRVWQFLNFLKNGFKALETVTTDQYKPTRSDLSIEVVAGEKDGLISARNFKILQGLQAKSSGINFIKYKFLKNIRHNAHAPGSPAQELVSKMVLDHINKGVSKEQQKTRQELLETANKISKIIEESKLYKSDYAKLLIPKLQRAYARDEDPKKEKFKAYLRRAFQKGDIHFSTLLDLHRLTIDPSKDSIVTKKALSDELKKYNQNKTFKKMILGSATTITHLKELATRPKGNIYQSEIELILQLRDDRNSSTFFRGGTLKTNSHAFFVSNDKNLALSDRANEVDEIISNLKNLRPIRS